MTLDVVFSPLSLADGEVEGKTVVVCDVLRATTTICAALWHGATAVIAERSAETARRRAQTFEPDRVVLAGERRGLPIPGFNVGNSPLDMTPARVAGRTLVLTTTNGTWALSAVAAAAAIYPGSVGNFTLLAAVTQNALDAGEDVVIVCAGRHGAFGIDDAYCAGRLVLEALRPPRPAPRLNSAARYAITLVEQCGRAWEPVLRWSAAGRALRHQGFDADIACSATQDAFPVVAAAAGHRITRAPRPGPGP